MYRQGAAVVSTITSISETVETGVDPPLSLSNYLK